MSFHLSSKEWRKFKAFIDNLLELPMSTEQKLLHLEQPFEGKADLFNALKRELLTHNLMCQQLHGLHRML